MVDLHITRLVKRDDRRPDVRDHRQRGRRRQARRPARAARRRRGVRRRRRPRRGAGQRRPGWRSAPASTRCATPGIPLVMRYKTTTLGTQLPDRWGLPDALRDDTGVIFASAFPGYDSFADDLEPLLHRPRPARAAARARGGPGPDARRRAGRCPRSTGGSRELRHLLEAEPFAFDRRFLFRCLSMGHSQFAEIIGARGPEHPGERRLREHHPGAVAGRGLDPRRPLPPRGRGLGRRRHRRRACCPGSPPASWPPARPPPTTSSRTPRRRSTGAGTA